MVLSADLRTYEGVELTGVGGAKPRLATRIDALHKESDTRIRLDLSEMTDGAREPGISDKAFIFEELCKALGADRIIDADTRPSSPSPSPPATPPVTGTNK